jgi:hypothetical protein
LYSILIFGVIILIKFQYNTIEILTKGKEIIIEKGYFSIPVNCEYLSKNNSFFLKFEYKNKSHSIRIKSKDCFKIKKLDKLKLLTNSKEDTFIYNPTSKKINLGSSMIIFLILSICIYKIFRKTKH